MRINSTTSFFVPWEVDAVSPTSCAEVSASPVTPQVISEQITPERYDDPLTNAVTVVKTATGKQADCIESCVCSGIFIELSCASSFAQETEKNLVKISQTESGKQVFSAITRHCQNGRYVIISASEKTYASPFLTDKQEEKYAQGSSVIEKNVIALELCRKQGMVKATGVCAQVYFNPNLSLDIDEQGWPCVNKHNPGDAFIALFHELIHGMKMLKGTCTNDGNDRYDPRTGAAKEEQRTVGIGQWATKMPSENSLRRELGKPLRLHYAKKALKAQ